MRRGGAGRRDGIVDAVDLEPGGERGRSGGGHGLRHGEGADALRAVVLQRDIGGFDDGTGGRTARTHDDAGTLITADIALFETGIGDRLLHGHMVPRAALRQEAHGAAVYQIGRVERGLAPDLAFETVFGKIRRK
ncbi:hypothetical protein D3C78_1481210 [compost metagenome]